jgi:acetyl esterase
MRIVLLALLTLVWPVRLAAAECLPLAPRNPDGNYIVPGALGDIVYRRVEGRELALDAYVQQGEARRPLVVVVHGGGWSAGSRVSFVGQLLETLTTAGFNWVSIDYRLSPKGGRDPETILDAVGDVEEAVAFVRCHAAALRTDPDRLVLLGEDSGAHLAAIAVARRPGIVAASVLLGGFYDLRAIASIADAGPLPPEVSPVLAIHQRIAPTLTIHGASDTESPPSQPAAWCDAVRAAGGVCDRLMVSGASHRVENWWPRQWGYKRRMVEWLVSHVGDPGAHTLDLWTPEGRGPFPLVVLAHGGGWEAGDRVTYITPLFEPLARAGFAWASIDYRLTPQVLHGAQLGDLASALAFLRTHAREYRLDPSRIVLVGESASGQMVMQHALTDQRLAGVVSFYGVYDFAPLVTDASPRSLVARLFGQTRLDADARAEMRRFSPIHHVHRGMPPVLLVHGTNERLWDQGVAMEAALQRAGVPGVLVRLEGSPHGMENWEGIDAWAFYKERLVTWLRERARSRPRAGRPRRASGPTSNPRPDDSPGAKTTRARHAGIESAQNRGR